MVEGEVGLVSGELALVCVVGYRPPFVVDTQSLLLIHDLADVAGQHFAYMAEFKNHIFILLAVEIGGYEFHRVTGGIGDVAVRRV